MTQVMLNDDDDDDDDGGGPKWWRTVRKHLNFYRIHVMYYIFTPLIFSAIFYASNGKYRISYVDSLFNCVSAMTVCGLVTIDLSALTGWQQAILFIQMCIGTPVFVSWIVVYQRRHYFAIKFEHVLKANAEREAAAALADTSKRSTNWPNRISTFLRGGGGDLSVVAEDNEGNRVEEQKKKKKGLMHKLRPDMIRRMDDVEPKRINPSGFAVPLKKISTTHSSAPNGHLSFAAAAALPGHNELHIDHLEGHNHPEPLSKPTSRRNSIGYDAENKTRFRRLSDPGMGSRPESPVDALLPRSDTVSETLSPPRTFPRTQTIEFAPSAPRRRGRTARVASADEILEDDSERPEPEPLQHSDYRSMNSRRASLSRQPSVVTGHTAQTRYTSKSFKNREFGGFPMPYTIIKTLFRRFFPKIGRKITRTVTIPATTSLVAQQKHIPPGAKAVPYISFNAIVGRNSAFQHLSNEEMEELGGVEYRALNALLWIVGGYHILTQLAAFTIIAPYISMPKWRHNFVPPEAIRPQNTVWFSILQSVSAYTNTGMSLVDRSMIPFQTAYPMVVAMAFLILAGNTAFPVFLRFTIWVLTKLVPHDSRANETLHFLLDHPRRCYILLFPSHQTWFLVTIILGLTGTDWFFFLVLDIGNPVIEAIPVGTRILVGLFQAIAVRAAGFSAVSLAALAAGVKVLYVVMMYISVYPIAMSIRSTNVYEEQSLGIFPEDEETDEEDFEPTGPRVSVWSRYLAMHARKQLAFDMWWLGLALFLVCIIERHNLDDPLSAIWFNIFSVVFELVSAYGTVGLSLGVPTDNYSFAGALRPLSKLIFCVVMIRGRHRILPVAIDRAVMLPSELQRALDRDIDERSAYFTRTITHPPEDDSHDVRSSRRYPSPGESRQDGDAHPSSSS
ncbi:Low-affinity potassium transport protein [Hypsizygus marmoreus]|uniref:Potassium transport protein n=1 Tax=Hypsizygus marmoreus TaxID=39966 RepID=A0A369JUA0_HYPMA|nr:Low-affinity potassium transport protein [Hypsizygus marmoreus]